jgi:polyhydroxyalkanoate synthesis regulator phasin
MNTYHLEENCKVCGKIDTKMNRIQKEEDRIRRWRKEDKHARKASIAAAEDAIRGLQREVADLNNEKYEMRQQLHCR